MVNEDKSPDPGGRGELFVALVHKYTVQQLAPAEISDSLACDTGKSSERVAGLVQDRPWATRPGTR